MGWPSWERGCAGRAPPRLTPTQKAWRARCSTRPPSKAPAGISQTLKADSGLVAPRRSKEAADHRPGGGRLKRAAYLRRRQRPRPQDEVTDPDRDGVQRAQAARQHSGKVGTCQRLGSSPAWPTPKEWRRRCRRTSRRGNAKDGPEEDLDVPAFLQEGQAIALPEEGHHAGKNSKGISFRRGQCRGALGGSRHRRGPREDRRRLWSDLLMPRSELCSARRTSPILFISYGSALDGGRGEGGGGLRSSITGAFIQTVVDFLMRAFRDFPR